MPGAASALVLKTYCILCIGTYVAVIGLFLVSGATNSVPMTRLPGRLAADLCDGAESRRVRVPGVSHRGCAYRLFSRRN